MKLFYRFPILFVVLSLPPSVFRAIRGEICATRTRQASSQCLNRRVVLCLHFMIYSKTYTSPAERTEYPTGTHKVCK